MRIISQDNKYDFSYEQSMIEISKSGENQYSIYASTPFASAVSVAKYLSNQKAEKAMKMLRDNYCNETKICGMVGCERLYIEGIVSNQLKVFQFPADEDLEVSE